MAAGGAGILAPLVEAFRRRHIAFERRWRTIGPALLVGSAIAFGVVLIAPLMYLVAHSEYRYATTPLRLARQLKLKNAIVTITPGHTTEYNEMNLSQNAPMDPNPDVLFLIVRSDEDVACAREHFPGRTWYRSGCGEVLEPY